MSVVREVIVGDKRIRLEFNKFAKQANGACMVTCGDTQVLVTVCAADEVKDGQDFFPLTVDYLEKFYAAGRIPGGFFKREAKPTERESLTSRVIDRPLRPCFPEGFMAETQIIATVMSYDPEHSPAPLALLGASAALMVSDIPFNGPVAALRVGMKDGQLVLDPKPGQAEDLDLNVACRPDAILMVEAGANFLTEDQMLDAITRSHEMMQPLFDVQLDLQKAIGKPKRELPVKTHDETLVQKVRQAAKGKLAAAFAINEKHERSRAVKLAKKETVKEILSDGDDTQTTAVKQIFDDLQYQMMRAQVLEEGRRIGGRSLKEIRPILCEIGILKRPHGSSLFQRGETQAVATVTLGAGDD